jgi:hypothetical protein
LRTEYENDDATDDEVSSAVEAIAKRANGSEITTRHIFDLVLASDHAGFKRHNATVKILQEHIAEANIRDMAILELQHDRTVVPPAVAAAIHAEHVEQKKELAEHTKMYHKPRRSTDNTKENHREERNYDKDEDARFKVWVLWGIFIAAGTYCLDHIDWLLVKLFH